MFGEQVASKDGLTWFDLVSTDLEGQDFTVGAADSCAAGVGAPHIRQRLYFVANTEHSERRTECEEHRDTYGRDGFGGSGDVSKLADSNGGDASTEREQRSGEYGQQQKDGGVSSTVEHAESGEMGVSGCSRKPRGSFWSECDWLACIDGKARPVEPGTFPLAHGVKNRVGLLRGYGNSLVAPVAQAFIEAYLEVEEGSL